MIRDLVAKATPMVLSLGALTLALGIGWLVTVSPGVALAVASVVVLVGSAVAHPVLVPVLAMPVLVVNARFGAAGVDLTLSDLALALAFWPAVLMGHRPFSAGLRQLLWLNALYQAATLLTVVANPFLANTVEWFHAWLLVSGSLVVGWAVGRGGYAKQGLTLFLLACLVLAGSTITQGILQFASGDTGGVYPRWPWSMHKNFVGTLLGFAAVIAYAHPPWMGWPRRWALASFWVFGVAIALSQSRQALLTLGLVLVLMTLVRQSERRRSRLILVGVVPALLLVGTLIRDQVESGNQFNSVFQRIDWYSESWSIWLESPWWGHGLRYWVGPDAPGVFQPPNVVLEVLATTGVIGLVAFVIMTTGMLRVLWKMDPAYGVLAFAIVLSRLVQGQFDLFWVSVSISVPFAIVGVCMGAQALSREQDGKGVGSDNVPAGRPREVAL